jgi:hypothetical protein
VDRIYENETLAQFWRRGALVPNRARPHPYQVDVPDRYRTKDRWFALDTSLDPPRPWTMQTNIPVFSLALVTGQEPQRRWLLYAHSPLEDRRDVRITIPEFGAVTVDVPRAGAFYTIDEKARKAVTVAALVSRRPSNDDSHLPRRVAASSAAWRWFLPEPCDPIARACGLDDATHRSIHLISWDRALED